MVLVISDHITVLNVGYMSITFHCHVFFLVSRAKCLYAKVLVSKTCTLNNGFSFLYTVLFFLSSLFYQSKCILSLVTYIWRFFLLHICNRSILLQCHICCFIAHICALEEESKGLPLEMLNKLKELAFDYLTLSRNLY